MSFRIGTKDGSGSVYQRFTLEALLFDDAGVFLFSSPASLLFVPLAAVLFTVTVVVTGAVAGYAVAWLVATSRFVASHKMILGTATSLLVMGLYFLFLWRQLRRAQRRNRAARDCYPAD